MASRKWIVITVAVLTIAVLVIGVVAWWWFSIVEGLRPLWHAYIARREYIVPLVPLISNLLTVFVALGAAWIALARHFAQTRADTQRRITESFSTAVAQLGDEKLEIRLGGIYTLERISRESDQDYWPIMEILTAFVREHARWEDEDFDQQTVARLYRDEKPKIPRTDIAAILTVLGRRTLRQRQLKPVQWELELTRLNLASTNLRGANLAAAHLERVNLERAHLEQANLAAAHLQGAALNGAYLQGAKLAEAQLQRAALYGAQLQGAFFFGANLKGAHLGYADLRSDFLSQLQIDEAFGNADTTQLPKKLVAPMHWGRG